MTGRHKLRTSDGGVDALVPSNRDLALSLDNCAEAGIDAIRGARLAAAFRARGGGGYTSMRVALVDDDLDQIADVASVLTETGCICSLYSSGEELMAALRRETFDVLLLDWNMQGMSGLKVLAWARENLSPPPPVIMLTNRDRKEDIVFALDAGAADYIRKPEDPDVVRARIRAALRRERAEKEHAALSFGGFEFDHLAKSIIFQGEEILLRQKEYDLARLMFENLNRPLSRGYILQKVWHSSPDVETRTLDVHVSRLRAKLKLGPERGFALQTIFGFGYRLDSVNINEG